MERVSVVLGKKQVPIILVAPHGCDDDHTAEITEACAKAIGCYAVINKGFERANYVDVLKDKADCNNVDHCLDDIVYEEYLHYILKYVNEIKAKRMSRVFIYHIHGFGQQVKCDDGRNAEMILGCGLGGNFKDSLTCKMSRTKHFASTVGKYVERYMYAGLEGIVCLGKGGGRYAARSSQNMNQYFRKHDHDTFVESMQIEICLKMREKYRQELISTLVSGLPEISIDPHLNFDDYPDLPQV